MTTRYQQLITMRAELGSYTAVLEAMGFSDMDDDDAWRCSFEWVRLGEVGKSMHSIVQDGIKLGVISE